MKIGIICNSLSWGGLELFMGKIALWSKQEGHTPVIFCPSKSKIEAYAQENKLEYISFSTSWKYADLSAMYKIKKLFKKYQIETCLIGHSKDIGLLALTKRFFGLQCKLVYPQQMQIGVDKKDFLHTLFYNTLDTWIAPLPWLKENTLQRTRIKPEKVKVIPFGIDTQLFINNTTSQQEARKILQLPENTLLIGIIGRFDPAKGQEYLVRALAILKGKGIEAKLVMIGEENVGDKRNYLQYLKSVMQELHLEDDVYIHPFQKQIQTAFKALDIFVMASIDETYGYVTLEAMASGLAVVGTNAGGTAQIIKHQENGLLFENKNPQSLAQALMDVILNPEKRQALSQKAQQEAQNTYDYRKQIHEMFG
jgi:D-inositol-3-phosphate glycosyltransferase